MVEQSLGTLCSVRESQKPSRDAKMLAEMPAEMLAAASELYNQDTTLKKYLKGRSRVWLPVWLAFCHNLGTFHAAKFAH